ncbi:hypothetical protein VTP01DRAFT_6679 [Rhizomucor pusillus]|uniref:uncharacterized protein n=1 Tax=Rhizomucor pusillus TaxID=4840 RepID=UPI0037427A71
MQTHRRRPSKSILLPRISGAPASVYQYGSNIRPIYARRAQAHLSETTPDSTYIWGYALLAGSAFLFFSTLYAILGSKYMPDTGIEAS